MNTFDWIFTLSVLQLAIADESTTTRVASSKQQQHDKEGSIGQIQFDMHCNHLDQSEIDIHPIDYKVTLYQTPIIEDLTEVHSQECSGNTSCTMHLNDQDKDYVTGFEYTLGFTYACPDETRTIKCASMESIQGNIHEQQHTLRVYVNDDIISTGKLENPQDPTMHVKIMRMRQCSEKVIRRIEASEHSKNDDCQIVDGNKIVCSASATTQALSLFMFIFTFWKITNVCTCIA